MWHPVKVLLNMNNLCAGTETLSLSVYEPIIMHFFAWGTVPQFWEGVELGGRVCYHMKVLCSRLNLFAVTVFQHNPHIWGRGGATVWIVVPRESPSQWQYIVYSNRNSISLRLPANHNKHFAWGTVPQFGGGVDLRGRVCYHMKVLCSRYNLFAGTEKLSLSVYEPIAKQILVGGRVVGASPKFGGNG